jgi:hypothetical protein
MNPSLFVQASHGFGNAILGEQLNGIPERGVFLPDHFLQAGSAHSGRLHLLKGLPASTA